MQCKQKQQVKHMHTTGYSNMFVKRGQDIVVPTQQLATLEQIRIPSDHYYICSKPIMHPVIVTYNNSTCCSVAAVVS